MKKLDSCYLLLTMYAFPATWTFWTLGEGSDLAYLSLWQHDVDSESLFTYYLCNFWPETKRRVLIPIYGIGSLLLAKWPDLLTCASFFSMLWVLLLRHTRQLITTVEQVSCDITFKAGSGSLKNVVGPVWTEEARQTNDGWWVSSQVSSLRRLPTRTDGLTAASKMLTIRYRR